MKRVRPTPGQEIQLDKGTWWQWEQKGSAREGQGPAAKLSLPLEWLWRSLMEDVFVHLFIQK